MLQVLVIFDHFSHSMIHFPYFLGHYPYQNIQQLLLVRFKLILPKFFPPNNDFPKQGPQKPNKEKKEKEKKLSVTIQQ